MADSLERFQIRWNHLIEKESLRFKESEHVLIEKVDQLFRNMFRSRYLAELQQNPAAAELREHAGKAKTVTLLFAAKDAARNNAVVLREFLEGGAAVKED